MTRGTPRKRADHSASGPAAPSPTPDKEAAGPVSPKKRGRKPAAPLRGAEAELAEDVIALATVDGQKLRLVDLARRARTVAGAAGSARDAAAALAVELRAVRSVSEIHQGEELLERIAALEAANARLEQQLGGQAGGVVRRDDAAPFRVPEGGATH